MRNNTEVSSLLTVASDSIKKHYVENRHHVACALSANNRQYIAYHLDTEGGLDICAESVALSNALADGNSDAQALVTVAWTGDKDIEPWVITPCGNCRQILAEYAPNLVIALDDSLKRFSLASELLPEPYVKRKTS